MLETSKEPSKTDGTGHVAGMYRTFCDASTRFMYDGANSFEFLAEAFDDTVWY